MTSKNTRTTWPTLQRSSTYSRAILLKNVSAVCSNPSVSTRKLSRRTSTTSPVVSVCVSPSCARSSRSLICFSSTTLPTTWTSRPCSGSKTVSVSTAEPSCSSPTTVTCSRTSVTTPFSSKISRSSPTRWTSFSSRRRRPVKTPSSSLSASSLSPVTGTLILPLRSDAGSPTTVRGARSTPCVSSPRATCSPSPTPLHSPTSPPKPPLKKCL
mmetsp:Transcript_9402/g.17157  ORF Transcript_9402/g.17157 Transcript_9402/m.17157 type:complete len:212 (+) Transcript_9402:498-1133(+)